MDYTFAELLTREQLMHILIERQLNLSNISEMSQDELVRIYKSFALPLARRESNRSHRHQAKNTDTSKPAYNEPIEKAGQSVSTAPMDVDESEHFQLLSKIPNKSNCVLAEKITSREKRRRDYQHLNPITDEFLSIATKRIKITWP